METRIALHATIRGWRAPNASPGQRKALRKKLVIEVSVEFATASSLPSDLRRLRFALRKSLVGRSFRNANRALTIEGSRISLHNGLGRELKPRPAYRRNPPSAARP
jgi:hypothetical protein